VLNLGDVEMPATPDAPVALVSVWADGDFGEPVPVAESELQAAEEPEDARGYGDKPKRKPRKRGFCATGEGGGVDPTCGKGVGGSGREVDAETFSSQPNFASADEFPAAGKGGLVGVRLHEIASDGDMKSYESLSINSGTNYLKRLMPDEAADDLRRIVSDDAFELKESKTVYFGVDSSFDSKISSADEYQFTIARHSGITPERALNYAVKTDRTGSGAVYEMELPAGSRTVYANVFDQPEVVTMPFSRIQIVERGEKVIDGVRVPYRKVKMVDDGTKSLSSYFNAVDRADEEIAKKQKTRAKPRRRKRG
jgi:hypothetical protein